MESDRFDRLVGTAAAGSRRDLLRALTGALVMGLLARSKASATQLEGIVVLGAECTATSECAQQEMQQGAICASNGFAADGALTCCLEEGCCLSDAECCGERRCAPTGDVCDICRLPPFPTRYVGQRCASDADCVPSPGVEIACVEERCRCLTPEDRCELFTGAGVPDIPEVESALAVAAELARLEAAGQYDALYDLMHPDAQRIIPREAVVGWYREDFTPPAAAAEPLKVRLILWTWNVTGQTYLGAAEVAYRPQPDGAADGEEIRLVRDENGNWRWFFGRDRAFVNEQMARFATEG